MDLKNFRHVIKCLPVAGVVVPNVVNVVVNVVDTVVDVVCPIVGVVVNITAKRLTRK